MVLDSCGLILHYLECIWMVWNVLDSLAWSWTFFPAQVVCASFWTSCCDWCRLCQTFRSCGSDYCLRRRPCQALSNIWTTFPWSSCPIQIGNSKNKLVTKLQATFQIVFGPTTSVIVASYWQMRMWWQVVGCGCLIKRISVGSAKLFAL